LHHFAFSYGSQNGGGYGLSQKFQEIKAAVKRISFLLGMAEGAGETLT